MNKNYDDQARVIQKTAECSYCVMKFCFQLRDIVRRHFNQIAEYSNYRRKKFEHRFQIEYVPYRRYEKQPILYIEPRFVFWWCQY